jgi:hypothetical protein
MINKILISGVGFLTIILLSSYACFFCKRQGIEGHIYRVQGNQMPSPDIKPSAPPPLQTTLYIYELTNRSQALPAGEASFYRLIRTKLVKTVQSDKKGHFKVRLQPGQYSLFIKKDDLFYANISDDKDNLAPVTVSAGKYTTIDIKGDWGAVY